MLILTPFSWKNKYMSNMVVTGPYTMYFKWVLCFVWPMVARNGKRIYISMKIYRCSSR